MEVRHRQEGVRRGLEPDELDAVRRRPGLVELDVAHTPLRERLEGAARPEVAALGERDRVARLQQRQDECRRRAGARGKEQRLAALDRAERVLRRRDRRRVVARVVETAGRPVLVRPDRRAVEIVHDLGL